MTDNRRRIHVSFNEATWKLLVEHCRRTGDSYGEAISEALHSRWSPTPIQDNIDRNHGAYVGTETIRLPKFRKPAR